MRRDRKKTIVTEVERADERQQKRPGQGRKRTNKGEMEMD